MFVDLEELECMYDELEDTYSSLGNTMQRMKLVASEIWNYIDVEDSYLLRKRMQGIIESVHAERIYTGCLLQALEAVMKCYSNVENEVLESLGVYSKNPDYEQVEYYNLDEVQNIIKGLF